MKESRLLRVILIPAVLGAYIACDVGKDSESPSQAPDPAWQPKVERTVTPAKSSSFFGDFDLFSSGSSAEITPTAKAETATATLLPTPIPIMTEFTPTPQLLPDINELVPEPAVQIAPPSPQIAQTPEQAQSTSCEPAWEQNFQPTALEIPNVSFESDIQQVESIPADEGRITWPVPDYGIATSVDHRIYSIHVFGHSKWGGIRNPFADIEYLEVGSQIVVTNEVNDPFCFEVTGFALADKFQDSYLGDYSEPTVILQTTARFDGTWILSKENILGKVGQDEQPTSVGDLAFLVFAKKK